MKGRMFYFGITYRNRIVLVTLRQAQYDNLWAVIMIY